MANFYDDNADLRFYVDHGIDWEPLVRMTEYGYRAEGGFTNPEEALEFFQGVLDLVGDFAANEVAPKAAAIDREHHEIVDGVVIQPPVLKGIFEQIKALELHGICVPRELGGMNAPFLLFALCTELFGRADVSVTAHNGFHGGSAMAMLLFSILEGTTEFDREKAEITSTRFGDAVAEIVAGEAWASMDITEPGAGSDMAAIRTRGEQDEDGNWLVTGSKIFITSGHAKYHFVIARTEETDGGDAFAGLQGLSMFLVKTFDTDDKGERVKLASFDTVEDKLGHHGSATVAISFDRTPAELIGERGDGFKLMLMLMNNARVVVGFEALGLCEDAVRMARAYASERESMGKTIDQHEMIADYLDEAETDILALRALSVQGAWHEEMSQKLNLTLAFLPPEDEDEKAELDRQIRRHKAKARRLTPLIKYMGAEKAVEIARRALQIHGGYGYSTEYGAEKLVRDALVVPIYEGTSQIQALMAMKDNLMGILKNPRGFFERNARARWRSRSAKDPRERRVARLQVRSYKSLQFLMSKLAGTEFAEVRKQPLKDWSTAFKDWDPKRDFALAMLHAERLTKILTDVAVCEILLAQTREHPERGEILDAYLERAEPRCRFLADEITTTGLRLLATLAPEEDSETATG